MTKSVFVLFTLLSSELKKKRTSFPGEEGSFLKEKVTKMNNAKKQNYTYFVCIFFLFKIFNTTHPIKILYNFHCSMKENLNFFLHNYKYM